MLRPRTLGHDLGLGSSVRVGYASDEEELRIKVANLAKSRYGSSSQENLRRLFLSYDANKDSAISRSELKELLSDADVGNWATRGAWVDGIFEKVDTNHDNLITWAEYRVAARLPPEVPPAPVPSPPPVGGSPSPGSPGDIAKGVGEPGSVSLEPGAPSSGLPVPASAAAAVSSSGAGLGLGLGLAAVAGAVLFFALRR